MGKSSSQHEDSTHPDKRYTIMFIGLETGSTRLVNQYMKGKAYPFRPEQWPDVVLKGMELQNKCNWFPICTFILGLPGETREDTKLSLDLLYALKDSKWVVVPTLFVPLGDTRLGTKDSAKIYNLTGLQWEFFFTCWRYNMDFWRRQRSTQWKFNVGIPIYYYLLGRKIFGSGLKSPLFRLAHFPEWFLRRRLYLDFSGRMQPRWQVPPHVSIPERRLRPSIPDLSGGKPKQVPLEALEDAYVLEINSIPRRAIRRLDSSLM